MEVVVRPSEDHHAIERVEGSPLIGRGGCDGVARELALEESGLRKLFPQGVRLGPLAARVVVDAAVVISAPVHGNAERFAGLVRVPVAGHPAVAVDEGEVGGADSGARVREVADPGAGDELLAGEDRADEQSDDDEDDGDFDEGEAGGLPCVHVTFSLAGNVSGASCGGSGSGQPDGPRRLPPDAGPSGAHYAHGQVPARTSRPRSTFFDIQTRTSSNPPDPGRPGTACAYRGSGRRGLEQPVGLPPVPSFSPSG